MSHTRLVTSRNTDFISSSHSSHFLLSPLTHLIIYSLPPPSDADRMAKRDRDIARLQLLDSKDSEEFLSSVEVHSYFSCAVCLSVSLSLPALVCVCT